MAERVEMQSILFGGEDRVELSWIEERHVTRRSTRVQTLQVTTVGLEAEMEELQRAALALLDAAEVIERDPPRTIAPRGE